MNDDFLVLPVGHDLGVFHPAVGPPAARYEIRVGHTVHGLPSADEYRVWQLAHGSPDQPPLTWPRYRAALRDSGIAEAAGIAGSLAAEGLLCRVPPSGAAAVEFARSHRVMPLMSAVGVVDDTPPGRYSLGLFGRPVVHVDEVGYWLWFWGHVWDDLYLATGAYAEARRADGHADSDTTICLSLVLTGLHQLLSSSTAYLDTAW